jgi:SAM-dependent methyltransferase
MTKITKVKEFWNRQSCGEVYATGDSLRDQLRRQAEVRYLLEPYIFDFARFEQGEGNDILEVGVGMGADHLQWAKATPRRLVGLDLTERAVEFTAQRLRLEGFVPDVRVANAESLPFDDESFDIVYSWGVVHHTANPDRAIDEIHRVLRRGGIARVMIYNKYSIVGFILLARYGIRNHFSLSEVYERRLESPGTHAYTKAEAKRLFRSFSSVSIRVFLSPGDLLSGEAGQRHQGAALKIARKLWPHPIIRKCFSRCGLFMAIEAKKEFPYPHADVEVPHVTQA